MNKQEQIQQYKQALLEEQDYICLLCEMDMLNIEAKNRCLDHDHETGLIRGVLCRNCNSMEGKITNCIRRARRKLSSGKWFHNLVEHWTKNHPSNILNSKLIHPNHKTTEEKKELRNKRARLKRKRNRNSGST